ncbi:MAG: molybdenum cofactor biosynthesis protein [Cyanobacteria bacterium QS_8_64_29]|nr:MAG: molybdenum cofactor biosynthesis protein [Cyanobacteria bacterium QS_8_64_29]
MANPPHGHGSAGERLTCSALTVSDTRTERDDASGRLIRQQLQEAGHIVGPYAIVPDEPQRVRAQLQQFCGRRDLAAAIVSGGTGIAPRDTTYEAVAGLLEQTLPGFGELFRWLSYQEIGSRALASRAIAGVCGGTLVFALPGSTAAVRLGLERLILPELPHLAHQLRGR